MFYARIDTHHGVYTETSVVRFEGRLARDLWVSQRADRAQPIHSRAAAALMRRLGVTHAPKLIAVLDGTFTTI